MENQGINPFIVLLFDGKFWQFIRHVSFSSQNQTSQICDYQFFNIPIVAFYYYKNHKGNITVGRQSDFPKAIAIINDSILFIS